MARPVAIAAAFERGLEIAVRKPKILAGPGSFAAVRDVADMASDLPGKKARYAGLREKAQESKLMRS